MTKKIIVLGGGAAGWLTALYLNKVFKKTEIKLIESERIGILGAGEGSTPQLVNFLNYLNIDVLDLIRKTKGTIKNGINFYNWNGDEKKYFHGFGSLNNLNNFEVKNLFNNGCYIQYLNNCISNNLNLDHFTYGGLLTSNNKIDLQNQQFSIHFDAHLIAEYLKKEAIIRGVNRVEGEVESLNKNEKDLICAVNLKDKSKHNCDFIFDCSGFKRLVIGKNYKTKWIDYTKHLPMKKAVPFFLKQEESIKPCTHAIAMKYGWIWKIPLQHRFGAGYIYDSNYINEDQALEEAEKKIGLKLESPRVISFEAGRYEKVWVKNCIAVGLSAGFTEPLEATSLYLSIQQLTLLSHFKEYLFDATENKKNNFNKIIENANEEILDFLYLLYITKRKDSDFWLDFKKNTVMPNSLKNKLQNLKDYNFMSENFGKGFLFFDVINYMTVSYGLGLLDCEKVKEFTELKPSLNEYKKIINTQVSKLKTFSEYG